MENNQVGFDLPLSHGAGLIGFSGGSTQTLTDKFLRVGNHSRHQTAGEKVSLRRASRQSRSGTKNIRPGAERTNPELSGTDRYGGDKESCGFWTKI